MINIGISIAKSQTTNIWSNGISQNIINLYLLLKNSTKNYNVFLVNANEDGEYYIEVEGLNIYYIDNVIDDIDLMILLGSDLHEYQYNILKENNTKIVVYNCGTNYILDMQDMLFKEDDKRMVSKIIPDQFWTIPQNYETNKYYFETVYKKENIKVPFIWSSYFIDYYVNEKKLDAYYKPSEYKKISVFEPNIDIVKFLMYPTLIVEELYNTNPNSFDTLYLTNTSKLKENTYFMSLIGMLNVFNNGKVRLEGRYAIPYFLTSYTDVVLSHQIFNPLNYAYLDALYLNYPIVHNADMIKDAGYYYSGFDVKEGKEKLLYALTEHDNNIEEYNKRSKKVLERYLPTNEDSIEIYDKLIGKLLNI